MVHANAKGIIQIFRLLPLAFVTTLLIPFSVMAASETLPCQDVRLEIEQTQQTLSLLEQQQHELQQHVRIIYQELIACQTGSGRSTAQHHHCTQLEEEGPKQFQAMIATTTLKHQQSKRLVHQTRQAQLTCPTIAEDAFPQMAKRTRS